MLIRILKDFHPQHLTVSHQVQLIPNDGLAYGPLGTGL
jgi:hypothetical protein